MLTDNITLSGSKSSEAIRVDLDNFFRRLVRGNLPFNLSKYQSLIEGEANHPCQLGPPGHDVAAEEEGSKRPPDISEHGLQN